MTTRKQVIGLLIEVIALGLAWYWYDWKLALVLYLGTMGALWQFADNFKRKEE